MPLEADVIPFDFYQYMKLARKVAHDLRSPLSALKILLSKEREVHQKYQMLINHSVAQIEATVEQLSKRNNESFKLNSDNIYNSLFMLKNLKEIEFKNSKESTMTFQVCEQIRGLDTKIDSFEICNIISNLVNNAFRAINEGGLIDVCAEREGDCLKVTVSDNGCGISQKILRKLGKQRIDNSSSQGEGIGIYNAARTLEEAGGKIIVVTKRHQGTSVICYIPLK